MKNKLWFFQIPFVVLFTACFCITEMGAQGSLTNAFLHHKIFPSLRALSGAFTNLKFKIRGPEEPKNKIVIVEIDSASLEQYGRWPWHRDLTASLVNKAFSLGAKTVGLDIFFSEPDRRVSDTMMQILESQHLGNVGALMETDPMLAQTIQSHTNNLVLGWGTENLCLPNFNSDEFQCPVSSPDAIATLPHDFGKFAMSSFLPQPGFDAQKTPIPSAVTVIANIPEFSAAATHSGTVNIEPDPDGYIRRANLVTMVNGKPNPSLALEMARVGLNEDLKIALDSQEKVASLSFAKSGRPIAVNPMGIIEINFRGGSHTYPYVSAYDLLRDDGKMDYTVLNRSLASLSPTEALKETFKDAYVLIGITAIGVYDMRSFPFDSNVAGVEGHANILDNILSDDAMRSPTTGSSGFYVILFLMTVGAIALGYFFQKLEALQAIILFAVAFVGFNLFDVELLFQRGYNWDTGFMTLELSCIFFMTQAAKYMIEEKNKKFIKSAFAKYVAPSIVDSILKDPTKLSLGGERRDLTILFSDIRGFTTFSEKMDAKQLSSFLNDYLGIMTKIVFSHEGTLDKYIGDAVMAFWGAPLEQPKHYNSCMAAIAMMKALAENHERFKSQYDVDVRVGIGINTGVVSVGNMGSESNFEYTVIGDHVNLASRLEGLTKTYAAGIVTTRFTLDHVAENAKELSLPIPPHRTLDQVKVKGKKNAVELIQLFHETLHPEGLSLFEEGRRLYVKRQWDQAIEMFKKAYQLSSEADGTCVVYIERCEDFKKSPPAPDWDGAWEMHSK